MYSCHITTGDDILVIPIPSNYRNIWILQKAGWWCMTATLYERLSCWSFAALFHKSNFKAICLFALIICLSLIVLQGFQPTATGRGQRHQFHIFFMWYKEHRLTNGWFKHSRREASQTCSSPSSYQNVMVCEGEMGKGDEMVKKKSVGEIQRAYYEQWQNSKVRRTNRLQHSTYDKALNLNYLNYCVLNEAQ